ncbi:MAG: cytosine permease, partial [Pseudonocardiales bacterium]|nr:cytosine permease [Pseudonocardiales bacterium]
SLGFWWGMVAIALGNLVLMLYVGSLSFLAGATGKNFALTAVETFGRRGYVVPSGFLATIVIGWFAFQTGLTGSILHESLGWNEMVTTLAAGIGFTAATLLGIRALSVIGMIAAPVYLVLGLVAIAFAASTAAPGSVTSYQGGAGTAAMSLGAAVTLVIASFIDSGTMTADFTRWARNGREGFLAAVSAFPVGNAVALVVGGVIVALGAATDPGSNGGTFLHILIARGGVLVPLAVAFVFINLGSVCAHCLYNGAVGWGQLSGGTMRRLTLVLGAVGVLLAVAGIWSHFEQWLNLLGVIVPPIGIVLILDQLVLPRFGVGSRAAGAPSAAVRWEPFASWAAGSAAALLAHGFAPWLSDAVVGMVVAAGVYTAACAATRRPSFVAASTEPAMNRARL